MLSGTATEVARQTVAAAATPQVAAPRHCRGRTALSRPSRDERSLSRRGVAPANGCTHCLSRQGAA
jgi:hypothetical protein